jgi:hypothetical protein
VFLPCNEFRDRDTRFATNTLEGSRKLCSLQEQWTQYKVLVDQLLPLEQETQVE